MDLVEPTKPQDVNANQLEEKHRVIFLRDQTSGIASADSNSVLSLLTDENIDVDNSGNEFNLRK
jgi:hypothetical protein